MKPSNEWQLSLYNVVRQADGIRLLNRWFNENKTSEGLFRIDYGDIYLQEFSIEDADNIYRISKQPEIFNFLPIGNQLKERIHLTIFNILLP